MNRIVPANAVNRIVVALTAALVLTTVGVARADADYMRADGSIKYRFYTDWELLYVERDDTPDVEIGFVNPGGGGSSILPLNPGFREILGTDDVVDDDEHFGGRGVLGVRIDEHSSVEGVFMGWGHDRSVTKRDAGQDLFAFEFPDFGGPFNPEDDAFDAAEVFDVDYDSDFYSGEVNYRRRYEVDGADYRFNLLAGVRVVRLEEDMRFTALTDFPVSSVGTYDIATRNTLIGGQLGVESFVPLWDDVLELDVYGVAGGYANQANVAVDFFDGDAVPTTNRESRIQWDPAGIFEAAVHLTARVWRGVKVKAGYRAVYMVGIAAAPDQFARSGAASDLFSDNFDNDGSTVFHGPSLGVSVDF